LLSSYASFVFLLSVSDVVRGRVRFAVLASAPRNGVTSKLFPSVVETATGLAGSTLSNSMTGLSRMSANDFRAARAF